MIATCQEYIGDNKNKNTKPNMFTIKEICR